MFRPTGVSGPQTPGSQTIPPPSPYMATPLYKEHSSRPRNNFLDLFEIIVVFQRKSYTPSYKAPLPSKELWGVIKLTYCTFSCILYSVQIIRLPSKMFNGSNVNTTNGLLSKQNEATSIFCIHPFQFRFVGFVGSVNTACTETQMV